MARRPEIEGALVTRVYAISAPAETADPDYLEGLRVALTTALDHAFAAVELGEQRAPAVPIALLAQARMAARNGVPLETVLRRYIAGYSLLTEFVIQEAEDGGLLQAAALQHLLLGQAALLDRLIAAVSKEYAREAAGRPGSAEERRAERVRRLLDGELVDASGLAYDFDASHLGAIAAGPGAMEAIRELATSLDRRLLLIRRGEEIVWAWLGARRPVDPNQLERHVSSNWPTQLSLAIGEPAEGLAGWRLTHQQARAALPMALRSSQRLVRYADVALLASVLRDDLLSTSLREFYLAPLNQGRDGGEAARQTLRAYFAAERKVSSAAAALGVNRRTVANRLRTIEERLGRPLGAISVEIQVALRLEESSDAPISSRTN